MCRITHMMSKSYQNPEKPIRLKSKQATHLLAKRNSMNPHHSSSFINSIALILLSVYVARSQTFPINGTLTLPNGKQISIIYEVAVNDDACLPGADAPTAGRPGQFAQLHDGRGRRPLRRRVGQRVFRPRGAVARR